MSNNQEPFDLNNVEFKMPEENFLNPEKPKEPIKTLPLVLTVIIILLLLILGGLVWWGLQLTKQEPTPIETVPTVTRPTAEENNEPETTNADADLSAIQAVSTSGDFPDIQADIDATNLETTLAEMITIDNLINAAP